eukprot:GFUD01006506.1.p1 GENE.GFUD01006506.1~~GFUD01006506.1.p1  ORF type:complete len:183 (-),score=47.01 GFUD01006506.1:145-693(-)
MITLTKRLRQESDGKPTKAKKEESRVSIRDKLLIKEVQEMEENKPPTVKIKFDDPNVLHDFYIIISPEDGFWQGGRFKFHVKIPAEYNMVPPDVVCLTKLWHPNISVEGSICLSLLRPHSVDGLGWAPTRKVKDVVWGLSSLFSDLTNFEDPLNIEAADHYRSDRESFRTKVRDWVTKFAKR